MREIHRVETIEEASLLKSKLESYGVNAFLRDEATISIYMLYSNAIGGIKILVSNEDESRAKEILELPMLDISEHCCPQCGSTNIRHRKLSTINGIFIFIGFCLPLSRKRMCCYDCLNKFRESDLITKDLSDNPDYQLLLNEALKYDFRDTPIKPLPGYFSILKGSATSLIAMLAISLVFYFKSGELLPLEYYLAGMALGGMLGALLKYTDGMRENAFSDEKK